MRAYTLELKYVCVHVRAYLQSHEKRMKRVKRPAHIETICPLMSKRTLAPYRIISSGGEGCVSVWVGMGVWGSVRSGGGRGAARGRAGDGRGTGTCFVN